MKARVIEWEVIQYWLGQIKDDDARRADLLISYIESRTWGKLYQSQCAIRLDKNDQRIVDKALALKVGDLGEGGAE